MYPLTDENIGYILDTSRKFDLTTRESYFYFYVLNQFFLINKSTFFDIR